MAASCVYLTLLLTSLAATSTPLPTSYHDQRQEGETNIDAHVGNFAVLIIPSSSFNILDFLMMMGSKKGEKGYEKQAKSNRDLSKSSNDVEIDVRAESVMTKLHPHDITSDVLIAFSPTLALSQSEETDAEKTSKSISTTLEIVSKSRRTPPLSEKEQRVKLLSEDIDICSPGQRRDEQGNCEDIAVNRRIEHSSPIVLASSLSMGLSPAV